MLKKEKEKMDTVHCENCVSFKRLKHNFQTGKGFEESYACDVLLDYHDSKEGSNEEGWIQEVAPDEMCEMFHGKKQNNQNWTTGTWVETPGKIPYCSNCGAYSNDADELIRFKDSEKTGMVNYCPYCGSFNGDELQRSYKNYTKRFLEDKLEKAKHIIRNCEEIQESNVSAFAKSEEKRIAYDELRELFLENK